jgi:hypothetical protein
MGKPLYRYTREFKVTNFTRYNTDDIGAMIEKVYACSKGFRSFHALLNVEGKEVYRLVPHIPLEYVIKDYTGNEATMVKKPDRMVNSIQTLRFRPHNKLKVGNLEQLAIASGGMVPEDLVKAALSDMKWIFQQGLQAHVAWLNVRIPQLRIMPRRQRAITKKERQRVAYESIVRNVQDTEYRYDGLTILSMKTLSSVETLVRIRTKANMPLTKEETELLRLAKLSIDVSRQFAAQLKAFPGVLQDAIIADITPKTEK